MKSPHSRNLDRRISDSLRVALTPPSPAASASIRDGGPRLVHRPDSAELRSRNGMDAADPEEEAEKGE